MKQDSLLKSIIAIIALSIISIFPAKSNKINKELEKKFNNLSTEYILNLCLLEEGLITEEDNRKHIATMTAFFELPDNMGKSFYKIFEREFASKKIDVIIKENTKYKSCEELWSARSGFKKRHTKLVKKSTEIYDGFYNKTNTDQINKNNISDKKAKERCLKAKDYEGCMKYEMGK